MTVLREKEEASEAGELEAAGARAERQLAFYLRRAFGTQEDILVFNDLRIVEDDDAAQMDHLILHRAGIIVIESKSVTSKVKVNRHGEWMRLWNGHWQGMPSPVLQVRRQIAFLREYLDRRRATLRDRKLLGWVETGFRHFDMAGLVAVSDSGVIVRESPELTPEVLKADQIVPAVETGIAAQRKAAGLGTFLFGKVEDVRPSLNPDEMRRLVALLLSGDPRLGDVGEGADAADPLPVIADSTDRVAPPSPACRHCASQELEIRHGKFGYYWKCRSCDGNTPIDKTAPDGGQGRVRKQGRQFFLTFGEGLEIPLFENPPDAP